jgi:hypothetical protein
MTSRHNDAGPNHNKDNLSIRSNGLPLGQVALIINEGYDGEVLVPIGRIDESITIEIKGSLEQICKALGFTLRPNTKAC